MKGLSAAMICVCAATAFAGTKSASSGAGGAREVLVVPGGMANPALNPSAGAASLRGSPSAAPLLGSLFAPIDPAALPDTGKHFTSAQWSGLIAKSPDEGTRAILRSMPGDSSSDPRLSVTLQNGEKVAGAFRGVAQGKMIFESDGKLLGLGLDAGGVMEVRRQAEVLFEGDVRRDEEVVMHARAAVRDPFRDLASYVGRVVDLDVRELDDLKHSLHTASGRLVSADGDEIRLESEKGTTYIQREFHRVDAAALRVEHYSSRNQISSIGAVAGKVPDGAPVELVLAGGKTVPGRFYGVRKDAAGSYVLLETEAAGGTRLRGYRDFVELRTPGYAKGALLSASETIYTLPK